MAGKGIDIKRPGYRCAVYQGRDDFIDPRILFVSAKASRAAFNPGNCWISRSRFLLNPRWVRQCDFPPRERMRREAIQLNNIRPSSNESRDVGLSKFDLCPCLPALRLRAGDGQTESYSGPEVGLEEACRRVTPIQSGVLPSPARHNAEANCLGVRPKMRSLRAT
jgi:hypothetical protein